MNPLPLPLPIPLRALVIDDDRMLGEAFVAALRFCGFSVEYIGDSTKAVQAIEDQQPSLVTLDVNMPRMSGIEVLHAVRNNPATARTRIIMITASGMITHDEDAFRLADLVLLKPVNLSQLMTFAKRIAEQNPN